MKETVASQRNCRDMLIRSGLTHTPPQLDQIS
jgi:hypothetical protein